MRVLLDTNVLYRWFYENDRLSHHAIRLVQDAGQVFVSSVSLWEIAIKARLTKIDAIPADLIQLIEGNDFVELPVSFRHAAAVADLPRIHADPFDRLLIAQAICEPLRLLTTDSQLGKYTDLVIEV